MHQPIAPGALPDEQDVLVQALSISRVLEKNGWFVHCLPADDNLNFLDDIKKVKPDLVFNLVETFNNSGLNSFRIPMLLQMSGVLYTGNSSQAIYITSDKMLTKTILNIHDLPAEKAYIRPVLQIWEKGYYIFKPQCEDASVSISDESVRYIETSEQADKILEALEKQYNFPFMCEKFIWGREFNVSVIGIKGNPRVLQPAEIVFIGDDNPYRIVDYASKWDESSLRYRNSVRSFSFKPDDNPLIQQLIEITKKCWHIFKLSGYARVDFRVDEKGKPWILEINANPCSSPDSGLVAAAENEGISFNELINIIINEATHDNQGYHSAF